MPCPSTPHTTTKSHQNIHIGYLLSHIIPNQKPPVPSGAIAFSSPGPRASISISFPIPFVPPTADLSSDMLSACKGDFGLIRSFSRSLILAQFSSLSSSSAFCFNSRNRCSLAAHSLSSHCSCSRRATTSGDRSLSRPWMSFWTIFFPLWRLFA